MVSLASTYVLVVLLVQVGTLSDNALSLIGSTRAHNKEVTHLMNFIRVQSSGLLARLNRLI